MTPCKRCAELQGLLDAALAEIEMYREMAKPPTPRTPCPECGGTRGHQSNCSRYRYKAPTR